MISPTRDPAAAASQARILVCDDAASVRSMMALVLGRSYTLKLTATAEESLEKAPEFSPDLVITDLVLPGMSGRELVARLRAIPAFEEVPMILLSAVRDEDARSDGLEAGADDYLLKPIRERELLARVASLLRLRRAMLSLSQRTRALEELNASLRGTQQRLARSERLAAVGGLAAALAHDINNPLSLVTSAASSLVSIIDEAARAPEPLDGPRLAALMEELRAVATEITEGGRRLQGLGRDLRLFGADDRAAASRTDATDAARAAISLARDRAPSPPRIELTITAATAIEAPPHLVTLALLSILDRAVVSAGSSGLVRVEIRSAGGVAEITVSDDGPPIPAALLPRVFEPFVRPHPAHETRGLGLSVAARIVLGLGGRVDVDDGVQRGARFVVRLPLAPAVPAAPPEADAEG
jgi:signal transduction histidine kinase